MVSFLLLILEIFTLGNIDVISSHILSQFTHLTLSSNPLDCVETSVPSFKVPLKKELLQVGDFLFLITGDTSCHIQGLRSSVYSILIMRHVKVSCLLILDGDRHLVRYLEEILYPGHGEVALWVMKSLGLREMILRDQ